MQFIFINYCIGYLIFDHRKKLILSYKKRKNIFFDENIAKNQCFFGRSLDGRLIEKQVEMETLI